MWSKLSLFLLFQWKAIKFGSVKSYWYWFLPHHLKVGGLLSLPASVCPSVGLSVRLSALPITLGIFFQSFLNLAGIFFYSLGQYLGQVQWWVSQLIWYVHNWVNFCYVWFCLHIKSQPSSLSMSWMQPVIIMKRRSFNHWFSILITCPADSSFLQ